MYNRKPIEEALKIENKSSDLKYLKKISKIFFKFKKKLSKIQIKTW